MIVVIRFSHLGENKCMQFQDKLYSFLGDRVGGGGFCVGFHSDLIKERLVEFYKRYFNT